MKRILVSLAFLCLTTFAFSQEVHKGFSYYGDKTILGDKFHVSSFIDPISVDMSLTATKDEGIFYSLSVTPTSKFPLTIDKGMSLELTTTGGQTIRLTCYRACGATTLKPLLADGKIIEAYSDFCSYEITAKQIEQLAKGVKRLRIETTADAIEKTYKSDMIGEGLNYQYQAIKKEFSKPITRRY